MTIHTFPLRRLAAVLLLVSLSAAHAQAIPDAGGILRDTNPRARPEPPPAPARPLVVPSDTLPSVNSANQQKIEVKSIVFTGNTKFSAEELQAVVADYSRGEKTLADLENAAARISRFYRKQGYLIARALIPPQDIKDGVITIVVTEGRYGRIYFDNKSKIDTRVFERFLAPEIIGDVFQEDRLNRALLLMNGINASGLITANLGPGAVVGTTDVVLHAEDAPRLIGKAEVDNQGSAATGKLRTGLSLQLNSPSGSGDQLDAKLLSSFKGQDYARIGYSIPLGGNGLRVGGAYTESRYQLNEEFSFLDAHGQAKVFSANLRYPFITILEGSLVGEIGYESKKLRDVLGAIAFDAEKRNNVLSLSIGGEWYSRPAGVTSASLRYETGNLNLLNEGQRLSDQLSANTAGRYSKVIYALAHSESFSKQLSLLLSVSGQEASKNLDSTEKISLGGPFAVRAYAVGESSGDSGLIATAEVRYQLGSEQQIGQFAMSAFLDSGHVKLNSSPFSGGENTRHLMGVGAGLSLTKQAGYSFRLTYARQIGNATSTSGTTSRGRFWLVGSVNF